MTFGEELPERGANFGGFGMRYRAEFATRSDSGDYWILVWIVIVHSPV